LPQENTLQQAMKDSINNFYNKYENLFAIQNKTEYETLLTIKKSTPLFLFFLDNIFIFTS